MNSRPTQQQEQAHGGANRDMPPQLGSDSIGTAAQPHLR